MSDEGGQKNYVFHMLKDIGSDLLVCSAILISIWLIDQINHFLWGREGLVFFDGLAFPVKGKWIIDGAHMSTLVLFCVRTVWVFVRGMFR